MGAGETAVTGRGTWEPTPDLVLGPALGWVRAPSPVTALPEVAERLGLGGLWVKRDDLLPAPPGVGLGPVRGGTKIRKLDTLLAAPPWCHAATWRSAGAIGSGHLSTLAAAAATLGRALEAHVFWEPPEPRVLQDLAYTATIARRVRFYRNRAALAVRRPNVLLGPWGARPGVGPRAVVVPPGATHPAGMVGLVRAGIELGQQVAAGLLPPPDRVLLPLGSGGTAVGLALGLALAHLHPVVHAVAAVEPWLATGPRLARLTRALRAWGRAHGANAEGAWRGVSACPLYVDRRFVGPGYGVASPASRRAVAALGEAGVPLEPLYSGKAAAALWAPQARAMFAGQRVLFWLTPRSPGPLPAAPDWTSRLPRALSRRLAAGPRVP